MKKYVFGIIFALFLETLPTETRWRMPQELWEKVQQLSFIPSLLYLHLEGVEVHTELLLPISGFHAPTHGYQLL